MSINCLFESLKCKTGRLRKKKVYTFIELPPVFFWRQKITDFELVIYLKSAKSGTLPHETAVKGGGERRFPHWLGTNYNFFL